MNLLSTNSHHTYLKA